MIPPFVRVGDELHVSPDYSGAFVVLRSARNRFLHDENGLPTAPVTLVEDPLDRLESEYAEERVNEKVVEASDTTDDLVDEVVKALASGETVSLDRDSAEALFAWLNTLYVAARATDYEAVEVGAQAGLFDDEHSPEFSPIAGIAAAFLDELLRFLD